MSQDDLPCSECGEPTPDEQLTYDDISGADYCRRCWNAYLDSLPEDEREAVRVAQEAE